MQKGNLAFEARRQSLQRSACIPKYPFIVTKINAAPYLVKKSKRRQPHSHDLRSVKAPSCFKAKTMSTSLANPTELASQKSSSPLVPFILCEELPRETPPYCRGIPFSQAQLEMESETTKANDLTSSTPCNTLGHRYQVLSNHHHHQQQQEQRYAPRVRQQQQQQLVTVRPYRGHASSFGTISGVTPDKHLRPQPQSSTAFAALEYDFPADEVDCNHQSLIAEERKKKKNDDRRFDNSPPSLSMASASSRCSTSSSGQPKIVRSLHEGGTRDIPPPSPISRIFSDRATNNSSTNSSSSSISSNSCIPTTNSNNNDTTIRRHSPSEAIVGSHRESMAPPLRQDYGMERIKSYNRYDWSYEADEEEAKEQLDEATGNMKTITIDRNFCDSDSRNAISVSNSILLEETLESVSQQADHTDTSSNTNSSGGSISRLATRDTTQTNRPSASAVLPSPRHQEITTTSRSPTSVVPSLVPSPIPVLRSMELDTIVTVFSKSDNEALTDASTKNPLEYRHSSCLLQYASAELVRHLVVLANTDRGIPQTACLEKQAPPLFTLPVTARNPHDWSLLQPFLEPHAVRPAVVTVANLPMLLPWFYSLRLNVLLEACDKQLQQHVVLTDISHSDANAGVTTSSLDWNDVTILQNTLLLAQISVAAGLETTGQSALAAAAIWMQRSPNTWLLFTPTKERKDKENDGNVFLLETTSNLLQKCLLPPRENGQTYKSSHQQNGPEKLEEMNWDFIFEPSSAALLFIASLAYIPKDYLAAHRLNDSNDVGRLLSNPLFCYLLRAGIVSQQQNHHSRRCPTNEDDSFLSYSTTSLQPTQHVSKSLVLLDSLLRESIEVGEEDDDEEGDLFKQEASPLGIVADVHLNMSLLESNRVTPPYSSAPLTSCDVTASAPNTFQNVAEELQAGWNSLWITLAIGHQNKQHSSNETTTSIMKSLVTQGSSLPQKALKRGAANSSNISNSPQNDKSSYVKQLDVATSMLSEQLSMPLALAEWLHLVWVNLCDPPVFGRTTMLCRPRTETNMKQVLDAKPTDAVVPKVTDSHYEPYGDVEGRMVPVASVAVDCSSRSVASTSGLSQHAYHRTFAC